MRSELFCTGSACYYLVYTHHGNLTIYDIPAIKKMESNGFPTESTPIAKDITKNIELLLDHANRQAYPTMEDIFEKGKIKDLDAVVLENLYASSYDVNGMDQYKQIIDNIFDSGKDIPIYLVDADIDVDSNNSYIAAGGIGLALTATGIAIGAVALKNYLDQKKGDGFTRRDFFRLMKRTAVAATGTAIGLYFLGGHLAAPYYLGYNRGKAGKLARSSIYMNTEMFPTKVINLRNAIWARKLDDFIAPRLNCKLGKAPNIAVISGVMHAGLEWYLKSKMKRDKIIRKYEKDIEKIDHVDLNYIMELTPAGRNTLGEYQWRSELIYKPFL